MSRTSQKEKQAKLRIKTDEIINTLPSWAKDFFRDMRIQNKSEKTICQYAYDIEGFINFIKSSAGFKDKDLNSLNVKDVLDVLTREDLQEYIESISFYKNKNNEAFEYSPEFVSRKLSSLRSFYNFYFNNEKITKNTPTLFKNPKVPDKTIVDLDDDEIQSLIDAIVKDTDERGDKLEGVQKTYHDKYYKRDLTIFALLLGTGMRVSELCGVDIQDIDEKNSRIHIIRKGGKESHVFFGVDCQAIMDDYIKTCRPLILGENDCDALILSSKGQRMTERSVENILDKYVKMTNIKKHVTPHTLRKTHGTRLYEQTGDIYVVASSLGHTSVETTTRHYVKCSEEKTRSEVVRLKFMSEK